MESEAYIDELRLQLADYERYLEFELKEIIKLEKKIREVEFKMKKLQLEKRQMTHQVSHYEMLITATKAKLQEAKELG